MISAIIAAVDATIQMGNIEEPFRSVTKAIMDRTAGLLFVSSESIEAGKSVAEHGMGSLIAVELRSWFVLLFESAIRLLKLLNERASVSKLGAWVVKERKRKLEDR